MKFARVICLVFLSIFCFFVPSVQAQSVIPTIYCVGGSGVPPCQAFPSVSPSVAVNPSSGTTSQAPGTSTQPSTAPAVSVDPCDTTTSTFSNKSKMHRKSHRGGGNGFFEILFKFLLQLIELLLGGSVPIPGNPSPSTAPSMAVAPSDAVNPSEAVVPSTAVTPVAPCPSATVSTSVAPSAGTPSVGTPSTAPSVKPSISTGAQLPAQVFSLANWELTIPSGPAKDATIIKQPTLATYTNNPFFLASGGGIRFRAPVNGSTTSGSNYPRSELREMTNNGTTEADWSPASGTHTMVLDEAITAVPTTKRHIVAGQIHDGSSDVIVIRLEYPKLFVDIGGTNGPTLDANYTLGKRFTVKFAVTGGKTSIYYNNSTTAAYTMTKSYSNAYFKAGAYTQSNCSTEVSASLCNVNNYGEVIIYNATVTHS